jgi:5-methylcytosine-specific restriction protein B
MAERDYYKIGAKWDRDDNYNFYKVMKQNRVIVYKSDKLKPGDIGAISKDGGANITDIGILKSNPLNFTDYQELKEEFDEITEDITNACWYYEVEWINISQNPYWCLNYARHGLTPINNRDVIKELSNRIKEYNNNKMIDELKNLLEIRKNLILTGAPGVGKTYVTAEIAVAICDGTDNLPANRSSLMKRYKDLVESEQIAFTTFHQSLDYEEFTEGLKPEITDDGQVTYEVKSGIFKQICNKAKEKGSMDKLLDAINQLKDECSDVNSDVSAQTVKGAEFAVSYRGTQILWVLPKNSTKDKETPVNINDIKTLYKYAGQDKTIYEHPSYINKYAEKVHQPFYGIGILNYLKKQYNVPDYKESGIDKNYVFIIDEINRGNISKIFGELITLLEKDKRLGEENEITVTLPYSQEKFGVPSNLYIIGTMNTADRSIGQIDYALRRRFAFVPLKSDKTVIENYKIYTGNTKEIATALFENIQTFISANINEDLDAEDLMIGHSYFLCETEEQLKQRLEYEIIPLIKEYEKDGIIMVDKQELNNKIAEWKAL